jgi:hypothetical protein
MVQNMLPIEAVSGLWQLVCCTGTLFAAVMLFVAQPR